MIKFNELLANFKTEEDCKRYLVAQRWPNGVECPKCGNKKVFHATHRPFHWICKAKNCGGRNGYRFSAITKTVFENTKYPLREWFKVMFFMGHSKKGMSALQIHRMLGTGSYETAWYMVTRIRAAMKNSEWSKLMGTFEVDETGIGGKDKNRHWDKKQHVTGMSGKTTVIGAISRKGNEVCQVIENADAPTLSRFVRKAVSDKVDLVAIDEHRGYNNLGAEGYPHESIAHSEGEYVRGNVHTNNIESFWSLLKRGIVGTNHNVRKAYLPLYLAEFTFRHNNRKNPDLFGAIVAGC
jgi:hypothetical protein